MIETPEKKYLFPCNKWFDKKEDDAKIERDLFPIESIVNNANKSHRFIGVPLDYEGKLSFIYYQ